MFFLLQPASHPKVGTGSGCLPSKSILRDFIQSASNRMGSVLVIALCRGLWSLWATNLLDIHSVCTPSDAQRLFYYEKDE